MKLPDRARDLERKKLSYLAHDARQVIKSYCNTPRLQETLIKALCARFLNEERIDKSLSKG